MKLVGGRTPLAALMRVVGWVMLAAPLVPVLAGARAGGDLWLLCLGIWIGSQAAAGILDYGAREFDG
ncbi:MAG TPA: hypothetical protein VN033_07410 [Vulgatibacter sp.]|nr:hypothetical protein [Vulgatibacter sp.]